MIPIANATPNRKIMMFDVLPGKMVGRNVVKTDPLQTIAEAAPIVAASGIVTVATPVADDVINVLINGKLTTSVVGAGPTATTAAAAVVAAINANSLVNRLVLATSALGVVTLTSRVVGLAGNGVTLASSVTGAGGTTAVAGATKLAGGTKLLVPPETVSVQISRNTVALYANVPVSTSQAVADAVAAGS